MNIQIFSVIYFPNYFTFMKQIQRLFRVLSGPEKVLLISLGISFICTFLPWFYKVNIHAVPDALGQYSETLRFFAYNGITAVMGWFFALFVITAITTILLSGKNIWVQSFLKKHHWFYLFLTGESLFILILTALIYMSYSLQFSRAGIEYGLIFAIITNIAALFGAHFYFLHHKKIQAKKVFTEQMQGNIQLKPESLEKEIDYLRDTKPKAEKTEKEEIQMSLADYN